MIWLAYIVLGALAGILAGLFGIGGGVVLVPAFIALFAWQGISPDIISYMAVGSSLACIVFSAASSTWAHHKKGAVMWSIFWLLTPGICLGAWLGVHTAVSIPEQFLRLIIGVFLVLIATKMLLNLQLLQRVSKALPGKLALLMAGSVIGWVSAIFGIGGGTLTVPFLERSKVMMQKAVATSSACGLPIAIVGMLTNMWVGKDHAALPGYAIGYVFVPAVVAVVGASMVGANVGAILAHRLEAEKLRRFFALFMGMVGVWIVLNVFM